MKTKLLLILMLSAILYSCEGNGSEENTLPTTTTGVYVLNSGSMGHNNSVLTFYEPETKQVSASVFQTANGIKLGDTANDMIIYGSKMYIAVNISNIVFITDLKGKKIGEIKGIAPRKFASLDGKVYVSDYNGNLVQIDTTSFETKSIKVGDKPEGIAAHNGKIYVANSGNYPTYDTKVSVIDAKTFTALSPIEVVANPQSFVIDGDNKLYLISWGDNGAAPAALQIIDTKANTSTTIKDVVPTVASYGKENKMYIISTTYDASWVATTKVLVFDTTTDKIIGDFISDATTIENASSITCDKITGNVYVGASDYKTNGDMYIYSKEGKFIHKFDTEGINPMGAYFINE